MSDREELEQRRDALETRLQEVVTELVDAIVEDIPGFVLRSARTAFVDAVDYAEELDPSEVKALKADLESRGRDIASEVDGRLRDFDIWLDDRIAAAEGKTLEPNSEVWSVLQSIADEAEGALADAGIPVPEDGFGLTYRVPTWFIAGSYPPGLIEKYWTQLSLVRELDVEIAERDLERRKEQVAQLWDQN